MSDLGIDVVQIILSGDVAQGIQHLVQQIKQFSPDRAIAGELRVIDGDRTIGGTPSDLLLAMTRPKSAPTTKLAFTQPIVSIVNPIVQTNPQPPSFGEQESTYKV